ncbi:MAG: J domain-containing protein [Planctomycetaceae bacterium]|nr:J domain-containing protein [Planctomycetaceae bacterium]
MATQYETLGVPVNSSQRQISLAYRDKMDAVDANKMAKSNLTVQRVCEAERLALKDAHSVLGDPSSRQKYNEQLKQQDVSKAGNSKAAKRPSVPDSNSGKSSKKSREDVVAPPKEDIYVIKVFVGQNYIPSTMALSSLTALVRNKAITPVGACMLSKEALVKKTTGLISTIRNRFELDYTTNAAFFATSVGNSSTLHALNNLSSPRQYHSYVDVQQSMVEFMNVKVKKPKEELALVVFNNVDDTTDLTTTDALNPSKASRVSSSRSGGSTAQPTPIPTCKVNVIVGGVLRAGHHYVEVRTSTSVTSASQYHKEAICLAAPASYDNVLDSLMDWSRAASVTFNRDTHLVLKVRNDLVNVAKSGAKIYNMLKCDSEEEMTVLQSGESATVAILPRDLADTSITYVGGSQATATIDRVNVISALRYHTMRELQTGTKPPFLQHLRFVDDSPTLRNQVVKVLLKRAANTVPGVLTKVVKESYQRFQLIATGGW